MSNVLPPLDPTIAAAALAQLPSRLLKRAEKLAAESDTWDISTDDGLRVVIGQATVTLHDALECDCLLAPKCAHIGAVCVASPVGEATSAQEQTVTEEIGAQQASTTASPGAAWAKELPPPEHIAQVVGSATEVIDDILDRGLGQLSIQRHTQLLACLQNARVCGLPRLERALTGLVNHSQLMRMGKPIGRMDATMTVFRVAYLCHLLTRDPGDREAIGQARRVYSTLEGQFGGGAGRFIPLYAEPIVTASGFAGVAVVLATEQGEMFSVTKTPPGGIDEVSTVWNGPVRLGDLHCSHAQLAQKVLMITGGKASSDGRIGSGKGVRAALGKNVTLDMVRNIPLSDGLALIEGQVVSAQHKEFLVATTSDAPPVSLSFTPSARKTELGSFIEACQRYLSNNIDVRVACLVRERHVLCVWPLSENFELPEAFGGRVFPGLGEVPSPALENKFDAQGDGDDGEADAHRSIKEVINPWLTRMVFGGPQALARRRQELEREAALLETMAAPFGASLLQSLISAESSANTPLALALYANEL